MPAQDIKRKRRRIAPPPFMANFDSAAAMVRATGLFLRGKEFSGTGFLPNLIEPVAPLVNKLPTAIKQQMYIWSGWSEAVKSDDLDQIDVEDLSRWVISEYPEEREYPAVMIGSSNGAIVHLCAAMGIPWLPQTFLIPVRQADVHPDEAAHGMEAGMEPARRLLGANPDISLHHMHDPSQDRLMLNRMGFFRIKRRTLGAPYEQYLRQSLPAGGTIFLVECQRSWPVTRLGERHVFQHGGFGGTTEDEYINGSERVEAFLERNGSHRRRWPSPEPTEEGPESEWGFGPELRDDVERFARENGYRVRRIVFTEPDDLSPLVADLYRWWYGQRQLKPNRLLVECFMLLEPYWALRTGSVPFWMTFNVPQSLGSLRQYLDRADPYDDIRLMLFSHGVDSIGIPDIDDWQQQLNRARTSGQFLGVDEDAFPRDFATLIRYQTELKRIPARYPMPGALTISQLDTFLRQQGERYSVQWIDHQEPTDRTASD